MKQTWFWLQNHTKRDWFCPSDIKIVIWPCNASGMDTKNKKNYQKKKALKLSFSNHISGNFT